MDKIKIAVVTGTRPELIKVSVLLRLAQEDKDIDLLFIHSGQHYDEKMFKIFLKELKLKNPDYNMDVGSNPNSIQTGKMLISFYDILKKEKPDVIIAQGDTNTVFAAALSAFKNNIPFAHIEAGIRSFDMTMPEEVNRMLTSVCTLLNFAPTNLAVFNLLNEGINPKKIFCVGNTVVDAVLNNLKISKKNSIIEQNLGLKPNEKFILLTIHRPSNVDTKENFENIIKTLLKLSKIKIIFPVHPRSMKKLIEFNLYDDLINNSYFKIIEPLGYFDFLKLLSLCYLIITDSGGLQEEAVILKKPCITLRDNTERPESVEIGANILVGNDPEKIMKYTKKIIENEEFYESMRNNKCPFGDGTSSIQIINIIKKEFYSGKLKVESSSFANRIPYFKLIHFSESIKITVEEYEKKFSCEIFEIFGINGENIYPDSKLILSDGMHLKILYN